MTDQGKIFETNLMNNVFQLLGVKKLRTSSYHSPEDFGPFTHQRTSLPVCQILSTWMGSDSAPGFSASCRGDVAELFNKYYVLFNNRDGRR